VNDLSLSDAISDGGDLRAHFGEPLDIAVACMKSSLDEYHRLFIENSPFMCLATASSDGQPNVSPKGDAPGFVKILDENTLVLPDRPGNNKVESFENMVENPKVALVFFVPGVRESLRVHGEARVVRDTNVLELGKVGRNLPPAATVIKVTSAYFHCGKALIRSKLWDQRSQSGKDKIPSFGEILKAQVNAPMSVEETQAVLDDAYEKHLY